MKRTSFSIIFFVKRTRALKDGTLPIYTRITINGQRAEFVLQQSIPEKLWDSDFGYAKGNTKEARDINDYLDLIKSKLRDCKLNMEDHNQALTAHGLRDKYMGVDNQSKTILQIFKEHNERCKQLINKDFSPGTVERYITCYKHIEEFIKYKYRRDDLNTQEITPQFINDLEFYLKANKNCCHNTAIKYIKNFGKIIRIALTNGWMKVDPFQNIKYHLDDVDLAYLSEEELHTLINKGFHCDRLNFVKDTYLFCCFTGLAFIDIKTLTHDDIFNDKEGKIWIKKKRQKTKNWCHIPLIPPAEVILNKYKNHPALINKNNAMPVMTNQKMNAYLKEIADLCNIDKNLSTHTARHTFATTVTLANHISMEVVSKMLGHSSINMTKKYARVIDDLVKNDMEKIYGKYEKTTV